MTSEQLLKVHGPSNCHICGKPRAGKGSEICSYPHGMIPVAAVCEGMAAWEFPKIDEKK